jgi:hypothetical protein
MRTARHPLAAAASLAAVAILLLAAAAPALAKEGLEARLDAPIARDTPGGTELLVGMVVTVPDGGVDHPVEGTPVYLKLVGPDGSSSWQMGRQERTPPGHYTMRIVVPEGGVASIEVGIHGTTDLPITVMEGALVAGGITPTTAQVAPPPAAAIKPLPRASAPAPVAVAPAEAPATTPAAAQAGQPPVPAVLAAAALVAVLALLAMLGVRRARGTHRLAPPPPVQEG